MKLSPVLYVTAVKCRMESPPGAETSFASGLLEQDVSVKSMAGLKRGTTRFILVGFGLFYA